MNYHIIRYILGWLIKIEGYFMFLPFFISVLYREAAGWSFLGCALSAILAGTFMSRKKPNKSDLFAKEGYVSVALGWIVLSLIGALPFYISREIPSFIDALFEIISGFTTTGASILSDVEGLSHSILLWRSFSHWIGGMGVLVFMMAILPLAGGGQNMQLMRAESPGPSVSKLVPKTRQTAMTLYGIYLALTVIGFLALVIGGMSVFDSLCTIFGTAGTGGFGIRNSSMAEYSTYLQIIVTVFMMLFGVNFNFYFLLVMKKWKDAFHLEEVRWYLGIYFAVAALIIWNLVSGGASLFSTIHHATFQAASVMTTTGFSTVDFDLWPEFSKLLMLALMFVGACAGSTGGGIKVSRIMIYIKTFFKEIEFLIHPRSIKVLKMEGKAIAHDVVRSTNVYLVAYIFLYALSMLLIGLENYDFLTNFSAVAATFNNIGPGLSLVGPIRNFGFFSDFSKCVLIFDMLAGRLEIFPMLLLFSPHTWKK